MAAQVSWIWTDHGWPAINLEVRGLILCIRKSALSFVTATCWDSPVLVSCPLLPLLVFLYHSGTSEIILWSIFALCDPSMINMTVIFNKGHSCVNMHDSNRLLSFQPNIDKNYAVTVCSHCPSDFLFPMPIFFQILWVVCNVQKMFILLPIPIFFPISLGGVPNCFRYRKENMKEKIGRAVWTDRYTESYLANKTIMNQLISQRKRRVFFSDWRGQLSIYFIIHP